LPTFGRNVLASFSVSKSQFLLLPSFFISLYFDLQDGSSTFLRNVGKFLRECEVSHPTSHRRGNIESNNSFEHFSIINLKIKDLCTTIYEAATSAEFESDEDNLYDEILGLYVPVFRKRVRMFSNCKFKKLPEVIANIFDIHVSNTHIHIFFNGIT
jgi:hypothetical protein